MPCWAWGLIGAGGALLGAVLALVVSAALGPNPWEED